MLDHKQLGAIHIAVKDASLTDQEYREILQRVAGVPSSKYLTDDGYQAVMRAIKDIQYAKAGQEPTRRKTPQECKIWALWLGSEEGPGLRQYLPQPERTIAYLLGFARRAAASGRTKLSDLGDLDSQEAHHVIEALKARLDQEIARANTKVQQEIPF